MVSPRRFSFSMRLVPPDFTNRAGEPSLKPPTKLGTPSFANQKYTFVTYADDTEAVGFAEQINAVLDAAGWKVEKSKGFLAFMLELGISIMVDPAASPETQRAADAFVRVFNNQRILTTRRMASGSTGEPETIQIRVGKKPPSSN